MLVVVAHYFELNYNSHVPGLLLVVVAHYFELHYNSHGSGLWLVAVVVHYFELNYNFHELWLPEFPSIMQVRCSRPIGMDCSGFSQFRLAL